MWISRIGILASSGSGTLNIDLRNVYKAESNTNDSVGTLNGTASGGLTYTSGISGNAFTFNGTNSQVDYPVNTMNVGDVFSVSFWAYMVNNGAGAQCVISNYIELNGGTNKYGWFIYASNGTFIFNRYVGTTQVSTITSGVVSINAWNHITITRSNGSSKLYVNGVVSASNTSTAVTSYNALCKPRIGSREQTGVWRLVNGTKIDEINIWDKELTQAEVTELQTKYYPY